MTIRIFLPKSSLESPPGIILGYYTPSLNCYYVVSICSVEKLTSFERTDQVLNNATFEVIGVWCGESKEANYISHIAGISCYETKHFIAVKQIRGTSSVELHVIYSDIKHLDMTFHQTHGDEGLVYLYDKKEILGRCGWNFTIKQLNDVKRSFFNIPILIDTKEVSNKGTTNYHIANSEMLTFLFDAVLNFETDAKRLLKDSSKLCQPSISIGLIYHSVFLPFLLFMWKIILLTVSSISKMTWIACKPFSFLAYPAQKLMSLSSLGSQVLLKVNLITRLQRPFNTCHDNLLFAMSFDLLFGILFYMWISSLNYTVWDYVLGNLMSSVDFIGKEVKELIKWLMGIPIGLKLNSPLNQFLGNFFLHHVQLWLEYISLILATFAPKVNNSKYFVWPLYLSLFGFSFFLAFLSDVISLLTFHIYCFYVYAARLYGLQITALMSLWRLFRGKKWNPLRKRVDTLHQFAEIGNHRFFAGTLLFTILLFLLPTTALYYTIFVLLRIVTIYAQSTLHWVRLLLSCFPWCTLLLRIARPCAFPLSAKFDVLCNADLDNNADTLENLLHYCNDCNNVRAYPVKHVETLEMAISYQSYFFTVTAGLKEVNSSFSKSFSCRQFLVSCISGKLLRWN